MNKKFRRTPKNYDGTGITTHHLNEVIPQVLSKIDDVFKERADLIIAAWPDIIGPQLAGMTQVIAFNEGILTVKVKNSTLYSLLNQHDKPKLLLNLKRKFPKHQIRNLVFRIG